MEIDYKSAKITVDIKDSKVGTDISRDGKWAALHLTRNAEQMLAGASIPRTFLNESLVDREAAPLEPLIRGSMEDRFRTSFGDVRIHRGPGAAGLCKALQCRAFSLDRDIVFGEGQYAPESSAGIQLLAHELVHVMQQRTATARAQQYLVPVGDPLDDLECEANRLGEEALGAGLRSVPNPDLVPTIRRAFSVVDDSWYITTSHRGTIPSVSYTTVAQEQRAVLHLNPNSGHVISHAAIRTHALGSAIRIIGGVTVRAGDTDEITRMIAGRPMSMLHFVQIFQDIKNIATYAGRTSAEGLMAFNFIGNYGVPEEPLPDAHPNNAPYYDFATPHLNRMTPDLRRVNPSLPGYWMVTVVMDDHPRSMLPLMLRNFATNKDNYLYEWVRHYRVWTTLVVRDFDDHTSVRRPLMHVRWGAYCNVRFHWSLNAAGIPQVGDPPELDRPTFYTPAVALGLPRDLRCLADMTINPTDAVDELYNSVAPEAIKSLLISTANNENVRAASSWDYYTVPPYHFR